MLIKEHMGSQGYAVPKVMALLMIFGIVHPTKPVGTCRPGDHPPRELRKRLAGRLHCWGGLATARERVPTLGKGWLNHVEPVG